MLNRGFVSHFLDLYHLNIIRGRDNLILFWRRFDQLSWSFFNEHSARECTLHPSCQHTHTHSCHNFLGTALRDSLLWAGLTKSILFPAVPPLPVRLLPLQQPYTLQMGANSCVTLCEWIRLPFLIPTSCLHINCLIVLWNSFNFY